MKVRKYCLCGVKLEREVSDEDKAREIVTAFRLEHSGTGHGPTDARGYRQAISRIIKGNASRKKTKSPMPMFEARGKGHVWEDRFGLEICSVCLVVMSAATTDCKGAALILAREAVPVLVRK